MITNRSCCFREGGTPRQVILPRVEPRYRPPPAPLCICPGTRPRLPSARILSTPLHVFGTLRCRRRRRSHQERICSPCIPASRDPHPSEGQDTRRWISFREEGIRNPVHGYSERREWIQQPIFVRLIICFVLAGPLLTLARNDHPPGYGSAGRRGRGRSRLVERCECRPPIRQRGLPEPGVGPISCNRQQFYS